MIADASGNLYGTTDSGGADGDGTVFEIAKNAASPTGYSSTPTILASFNGTGNGANPLGGLIADASGNLYGTTEGGGAEGNGTVFEIAKNAASPTGYSSTPTTLATFNGMNTSGPTNGAGPSTGLIADASGNLYGTTEGGANNNGTVFELARDPTSPTGYSSTPTTLATFNLASNGPSGSLIADASGNLYGTTAVSGVQGSGPGTVFELTGTGFVVCFMAGTAIRTARGDVAVEALRVGDLVVTAAGGSRPITWLGHRTIDCRRHPRPREVLPVRIAAHAFGANRPARDLHVSPGHAICVDILGEVLIPAGALVDGDTIARVEVEMVTYWHVELDSHDLLLAEGLACESYLEMGNRAFFAGSGVVALAAVPDAPARTHADFCRPFHPCGPLVDAARAYLRGRVSRLNDAQAIRQIA